MVVAGLVPATQMLRARPCHVKRGRRVKPGDDAQRNRAATHLVSERKKAPLARGQGLPSTRELLAHGNTAVGAAQTPFQEKRWRFWGRPQSLFTPQFSHGARHARFDRLRSTRTTP